MPLQLSYPGVYVEEIPSGVRTITGVATSITAFVGRTRRGPTNEPSTINNYGDFERIYGGLWEESSLGYAVRDFYRNGGSQAIIVRLYHPTFEDDEEGTAEEERTAEEKRDAALEAVQPLAQSTARGIGEAARAEADRVTEEGEEAPEEAPDAASVADAAHTAARAAAAAARRVATAARTAATPDAASSEVSEAASRAAADIGEDDSPERAVAVAVAAAADDAADAGSAVEATDRAARAAEVAAQFVSAAAKRAAKVDDADADSVASAAQGAVEDAAAVGAGEAAPLARARLSVGSLHLEAQQEGASGNELQVTVDDDTRPLEPDEPPRRLFNLTVQEGEAGQAEQIRNVSVTPGHPRQVDKVLLAESRLVQMIGRRLPGSAPRPTSAEVVGDRASNGEGLEVADFTGPGKDAAKEGLYALRKVDLFNLLCIPPYKGPDEGSDDSDRQLIADAVAYCEERRAFLLVDPPSEWENKNQVRDGINNPGIGTRSKNAAVFFPRLMQANPLRDNQTESFSPSGAVAGVFARTDAQRGVWKAPAGLAATLVGVSRLSASLTDPEIGELNPLGVNCLRVAPAAGPVVWGSRTLDGDDRLPSEWKYIPVRRLALFIEESLYRGTQWVVFEPNDEPLWAQIRLNVGAFMRNLFRQGAFQGASPRDAYFVKCDSESTTQNDINLGIVNIVVGFAPLKPAEFVVLKIQQMAGQILT